MPDTPALSKLTPSSSLFTNLRTELVRRLPFSHMTPAHVDQFIAASQQAYYAPDEVLVEPASGPVHVLYHIRQGSVTGQHGVAALSGPIEYEVGDLFPVGAALGQRAVSATYTANEDTFCLLLPAEAMHALARVSPIFADFLNRRVLRLLELSRRVAQVALSSQTLAEHSLESKLETLTRKTPLVCGPATPLLQALSAMHERRVGSVLIIDAGGAPLGILTRHDLLGRVTLQQRL